jgi:hypothetical protein
MVTVSDAPPGEEAEQLKLACDAAQKVFCDYAGVAATLSWDEGRASWIAAVPVAPDCPTVAFELTGIASQRPDLALLAAVEILVSDAPPVIGETAQLPTDGVAVRYSSARGRWQAHFPCEACPGGWLDTPFDHPCHDAFARFVAKRFVAAPLDRARKIACPHCISHMMSRPDGPPVTEPVFWYDTTVGEWMLYEPSADSGASTPLGLLPYFVDRLVVARLAARRLHR